jgi:putative ABC transport system permease protein
MTILAIPLAWLQLVHYRVRFLATLAGITFVVILLFMQLGFQEALFESSVRVHNTLQGDLFLISSQYKSLTAQQNFPRTRLYQALALEGVESVYPLYFGFGKLKNITNGQKFSIFVFGINPADPIFTLPEINQGLNFLKLPDVVLFDRNSRSEFGPVAEDFNQQGTAKIEIAEFNEIILAQEFEVKGLFSIGPSFGVDGNLITSDSTFLRSFSDREAGKIDLGIITLKPNYPPEQIQQNLAAYLPPDIEVLTRQEFINREKQYWDLRTPVGFIFRMMVIMGFVVGIGISYQVLYSNISSHIVEYATLKAIGFANRYLSKTVFQQAFLLAFLGYIPGTIITFGLYDIAYEATQLPVIMTLSKGLTVLICIFFMCIISGFLAIQKLQSADPADIF